jgi:hypothetical protein
VLIHITHLARVSRFTLKYSKTTKQSPGRVARWSVLDHIEFRYRYRISNVNCLSMSDFTITNQYNLSEPDETFEDTKGITRSRKSKDEKEKKTSTKS